LQYFEARYYDNNIGRFRSIDRVFWEVGWFDNKKKDERWDIVLMFPQKQNAYSYVENNPLNKTDITWEFSDTIADSNPIALYVKAVVTVGVVLWKFVSDEVVDRVIDRGEWVVSVTGSPWSWGKKPKKENREKDIKSLEKQISIHKKKLENYIKNPDKYDNKWFLQKAWANTDLRNKIINSRIKHLKKEIQNFKNNIKKLKTN
jgi:RHS repeat-associated protein